MAVGGPQQSLSIPSPSELAGGPVTPAVTPNSVAIMSDALRQGFITADDIIQRTGKRAQLKEKADVMALTEQMSPEAVQARQAGIMESLNRSKLGAAQASAALPLVDPTSQLAQSQLESQIAYQKYPAAKLFDQYAPVLGIAEPKTPDGKTDWSAKASIGVQIGEHLRLQNEAKEKLSNITTEKSADGTVIKAFTKQGIPVDSAEVQRLDVQARSPFKMLTPGTATAPVEEPVVVAPAAASVDVNKLRADAINSGSISPGAGLSDAEIVARFSPKSVIEPVAPTASISIAPVAKPVVDATPAIGTPVAGGFSLGPAKASASGLTHYTETQQKALGALVRGLASDDALLNQTQKDPNFDPASVKSKLRMDAYKGGTIGQLAATIGQITPAERSYASAANAWIQGLLRAESGAAIAAKEQTWYEQTFFPSVGDPPAIQQQKSNLRKAIEQTFEQVIEGKMTPEEYLVFRDTIRNSNTPQPTTSQPVSNSVTTPSATTGARYTFRDGKFYEIK